MSYIPVEFGLMRFRNSRGVIQCQKKIWGIQGKMGIHCRNEGYANLFKVSVGEQKFC